MLDPLVHRKDREVSSASETSVVVHGPEVAQHRRRAVAVGEDPLEVVGAGEGEVLGGNALAV